MDSLDCKVREYRSNMNYTNLIQETLGVTITLCESLARLQHQGEFHILITSRSTDVIEL